LSLRGRPAARTFLRAAAGFAIGLAFWFGFAQPYETAVSSCAETVLRAFESPSVTRLEARRGEIIVERTDFPPAAPRPGLPAADLHFNFVILTALFALVSPLRPGRLLIAVGILFLTHVIALVCQVESLYATRLGEWSAAHYGTFSRNAWASAFHAYQIAGRFALPFAIWWPLGGMGTVREEPTAGKQGRRKKSTNR